MSAYLRTVTRLAASYGYTVTHGGKHLKLRPVTAPGPFITIAKSPSDNHRVLRNIEGDLRRAVKAK